MYVPKVFVEVSLDSQIISNRKERSCNMKIVGVQLVSLERRSMASGLILGHILSSERLFLSWSGCKSSYVQLPGLPHSKFGEASAWSFAARVLSGCA